MLQKLPWLVVLAALGAPRIGVTRAFFAFLEAKEGLFGFTVVVLICFKKLILKRTAGLFEKSCVFLPKNTLERCVACVIMYNLREKSATI